MMVQLKGEGSLGIRFGAARTSAGSLLKNGSNDESGEEDKMVSEEGGDTKSSF